MKYKAGDRVKIKSLDWYNKNKDKKGDVICLAAKFTSRMKHLCGKVVTIDTAYNGIYTAIEAEAKSYYFDGDMFEGFAEITDDRLTEIAKEVFDKEEPFSLHCQYSCDSGNYEWKHEFECPDGYEFRDENGNVIEAKKIVLGKKKPKYPQSYEECCKAMKCDAWFEMNTCYHGPELCALYKLLICRDAYWKLAGDWKPDWFNDDTIKWCICHGKRFHSRGGLGYTPYPFTFPTAEMRDAFYENFKELIEECKELL